MRTQLTDTEINTIVERIRQNDQRLQQLYHMMFRQVLNELMMFNRITL